jgi:hypothetical protein
VLFLTSEARLKAIMGNNCDLERPEQISTGAMVNLAGLCPLICLSTPQ